MNVVQDVYKHIKKCKEEKKYYPRKALLFCEETELTHTHWIRENRI